MATTETHNASFSGNVIDVNVTDKAGVIDSWVQNKRSMYNGQQVIVGLDSEWRPNQFSFMSNKTAVLQLCVDAKCLILQLFFLDRIPQSLRDFLGDPNFTFVGVEVARDAEKLGIEYGLHFSNVSDVREIAIERWPHRFYRKPGLKDIANLVVGLTCQNRWMFVAATGSLEFLMENRCGMHALMLMFLTRLGRGCSTEYNE